MRRIQFIFITLTFMIVAIWTYFSFFVKVDGEIALENHSRNAVVYDSLAFEKQGQQAVIQEKFTINTAQTGQVTVLIESRATKHLLHQKFEIKFGGLMLQGMIGNQSFGTIANLKEATLYSYDLKTKTYTQKTFEEIRQSKEKDKKKQEKPQFNFMTKKDSTATKNTKRSTTRTSDLVNGQSATKVSTKEQLDGNIQEINYWYAAYQPAYQKVNALQKQLEEANLPTFGMAQMIQEEIQQGIFSQLEGEPIPEVNQNIIKIKFSDTNNQTVNFETEYNLMNQHFLPFKAQDFSVPEQCKEKAP